MLFELGEVVGTPAAIELLEANGRTPIEFLDRHVEGDWGEVCHEDDIDNFRSLKEGTRILSVYQVTKHDRIWIITEADRSVTTILLSNEY